jgi:hypothetical protein
MEIMARITLAKEVMSLEPGFLEMGQAYLKVKRAMAIAIVQRTAEAWYVCVAVYELPLKGGNTMTRLTSTEMGPCVCEC